MKMAEIKNLAKPELERKVIEQRSMIQNLKVAIAGRQDKKHRQLRVAKKLLARFLTQLNQLTEEK